MKPPTFLHRGVTLLEALTVLVIIGIVVFVTLPHLTQSKAGADRAAARAKAIQLNQAMDAYISVVGSEQAQLEWENPAAITRFDPRLTNDDNGRFALIRPFITPASTASRLIPDTNEPYGPTIFSTPTQVFSFYPFGDGPNVRKIIGAPVLINGAPPGDDDFGTIGGGIEK